MSKVDWIAVRCNLCGADDTRLLLRDRVWREGLRYDFPIVQCRRCGLIYTNPRAKGELFGNLAGGAARGDADIVSRPIYSAGLAAMRRHLPAAGAEGQLPWRLLDVGCAYGHFMACAQEQGWQVEGVDISPRLAAEARRRGFVVHEGQLAGLGLPHASYDVVTMWDVVEHLDDPLGFLGAIRPLLRPGGLLFLHTGNASFQIPKARLLSLLRPNAGPYVIPFQHLYHFGPASARAVLARAGFETLALFSCGTLRYPNRWKRLILASYNQAAEALARLGIPLSTSAMGIVARPA